MAAQPYLSSFPREGKYIPLPQRVREGPRGGVRCSSSRGGRPGLSSLPPRGPHHLDSSSPGPGAEARGINGGELGSQLVRGRGGNEKGFGGALLVMQ